MAFYNPATRRIVEVLNDLVKINDDRVSGYEQALLQIVNMDRGLHDEFGKNVSDSISYKRELLQKIEELNGITKRNVVSPIYGKIYRAWTDLKVAFSFNTQKAAIASIRYNEEIALSVYRAALNTNTEMPEATRLVVERQAGELRNVYERIKEFRDLRPVMRYNELYFN